MGATDGAEDDVFEADGGVREMDLSGKWMPSGRLSGVCILVAAVVSGSMVASFLVRQKKSLRMDASFMDLVGTLCSSDPANCMETRCCLNPGSKCFMKHENYAGCRDTCTPGLLDAEDQLYA